MKNSEGNDACQKWRQYSDDGPDVRAIVSLEKATVFHGRQPPRSVTADDASGVPIGRRIRIMAA